MNGYWLALGIVIAVLAAFVAMYVATMVMRVRIAKHTGVDPRADDELLAEAQRRVREP